VALRTPARYDVCDVCGGVGTSCLDCNGIANGPTLVDICGVCGGAGATPTCSSAIPGGVGTLEAVVSNDGCCFESGPVKRSVEVDTDKRSVIGPGQDRAHLFVSAPYEFRGDLSDSSSSSSDDKRCRAILSVFVQGKEVIKAETHQRRGEVVGKVTLGVRDPSNLAIQTVVTYHDCDHDVEAEFGTALVSLSLI